MDQEPDIIINELDGKGAKIGQIILNRPKALNALSLEMCKSIDAALEKWGADNDFSAVMIKGSGSRAFCAGGDIRALYNNRDIDKNQQASFFWHEYKMNARLYHFKKPYISFLDGITMGGGAGVSLHGSHRVGTERLMFAMPETGIGFFPDVGASEFLLNCPGKIGLYLALTGIIINLQEAYGIGLVTNVIPSIYLDKAEEALLNNTIKSHTDVDNILKEFEKQPALADLLEEEQAEFIDTCFNQSSVTNIIKALHQLGNQWAHNTANMLLTRSPTSLKVTFEQLRRAESLKFDARINMDFDIAQHFIGSHDFLEGIRAVLVDKDNHPHWKPNSLKEVSSKTVEQYFSPSDKTLEI